jgi:hypothetical protein
MKLRSVFTVLFLVVLGGIIWLGAVSRQPPEPVYQGKPLTYWLRGYAPVITRPPIKGPTMLGMNSAAWAAATAAVHQTGTNAIPALLRLMRARDSKAKTRFIQWLQKHPRFNPLFGNTPLVDAPSRHLEAYFAFRALGRDARPAVPELDQIYETSLDTDCAGFIPEILDHLNADDPATVSALLLGATRSTDEFDRYGAFHALADLHAQPELAVPALVNFLHDPSRDTRADALMALARYGTNARPALPALTNLLQDPDQMVRMTATNALTKLQALDTPK